MNTYSTCHVDISYVETTGSGFSGCRSSAHEAPFARQTKVWSSQSLLLYTCHFGQVSKSCRPRDCNVWFFLLKLLQKSFASTTSLYAYVHNIFYPIRRPIVIDICLIFSEIISLDLLLFLSKHLLNHEQLSFSELRSRDGKVRVLP